MLKTRKTSSGGMGPMDVRWIRARVLILAVAFVPALAALVWKAADLQIREGQKLRSMAKDQYLRHAMLPGRRGAILDRRGGALAASVEVDSIFVDPSELPDLAQSAKLLAKALHLDPERVSASLGASRRFAWLKRRATPQEVEAVKALKLSGLGFTKEPQRFYPQRELAAHVLGFSGVDGDGLEGVERAFDSMLRGKPQPLAGFRDARGRALLLDGTIPHQELEGGSVTLTLDRAIQYQAEKVLAAAVKNAEAASGMAVVLDSSTGEILALANVPTFNPNDPSRVNKQAVRNRSLSDQFEPGSTFKIFTTAAALEEKAVRAEETISCEKGRFQIGKHAIHDHGSYDQLDVGTVLKVSSNIGTYKIAAKLGREKLAAYHRAFGFGEKPGLGLPGETRGSLPFPRAEISLATQSFGQGLTTSAIQLAAGVGAVANGGVLMRPYLVSRVTDPAGMTVFERGPEPVRQVVSAATSTEVLKMMRRVVEEKGGTAPLARMDDYQVGGKTGTAQKADPVTGGYSRDKRTASFVGVVPADRPRLVILVVIDEPKTDVYGGKLAAPAFKEIAQVALAQLGVPRSGGPAIDLAYKPPEVPADSAQSRSKMLAAFAAAAARADEVVQVASPDGLGEEADEASAREGTTLVPDVQGLNARAAANALAGANLEPALTGAGKAVGQTPPAGTSVERGSRVAVRLESRL